MGALDAFYSTWSDARETFGQGAPQDGGQLDNSSKLMQMKAGVEAAAPDGRWQGPASEAYAAKNKEHAGVYGKLAELDTKMATEVTNASNVVTAGRQSLENTKSWVDSMAESIPPGTSAADRDNKLLSIANQGIGQVSNIVTEATNKMTTISQSVQSLKGRYDAIANGKPDPGEKGPGDKPHDRKGHGIQAYTGDSQRDPRDGGGDPYLSDPGERDGNILAHQADLPPEKRDPEAIERVARNLPDSPLSEAEIKALSEGKDVTTIPPEKLEYYRDFYKAAGKDGLLLLDRHLETQEQAGNTEAKAQRDRLANGLVLTSNEHVVELNPDGSVRERGGYDQLPADLRELIESRRADPLPMDGQSAVSPIEQQYADVAQFGELLGEANPGYQPGTELGVELYLKAADMVEPSGDSLPVAGTSFEAYERAASSFAEIAGRNNEASYEIWSGKGDDLPRGYDPQHTVRTLIGEDWSRSGGGAGAATLLDWITEDSKRPIGDPLGDRARQAFIDVPNMLAPSDTDPEWTRQRDAFAHNPAVATEMSKLLAANTDALAPPDRQFGMTRTMIDETGHALMNADDARRLLELGSYSEDGRATLATAAETARINEIEAALRGAPGDVSDKLAGSPAGGLSGTIDDAMRSAIGHQNDILGDEFRMNPDDEMYRAKKMGAHIAGLLSSELIDGTIDKLPGLGKVVDATGFDSGDFVESAINKYIDDPEYKEAEVPDKDILLAGSEAQAKQAILQAAFQANQLDPRLIVDGKPINVAALSPYSPHSGIVSEFLGNRHLNQYVTDYSQNYGIKVDGES
ncbi:hypothetical protein JNN96_37885 [Mycobacterium sp. DSM 3803]|nr:hypothetical protein [Mycobacterium sp. DSM 3803]